MKVLVTGATGLIGCHASAELRASGHSVRVLARDPGKLDRVFAPFGFDAKSVEVVQGDITSARSLRTAVSGCQGLLHCAGVFSPDRNASEMLERTNVLGTQVVLESAIEASLDCIVHVSSMLALFPPGGPRMTAQDAVARPRSMYAKTKAAAERLARSYQQRGAVTIVYPTAVQGPHDPTFSIGPQLVADALRTRRVLVTEGGLPYTDVRDLVRVIAAIFGGAEHSNRLMAPSFHLTHDAYRNLLAKLSGQTIEAQRMPGWLLRALGRIGDVAQRFGRPVELTYEAAEVLTRSVPVEDGEARGLLGREALSAEASFRDLIAWMLEAGHLEASDLGAAISSRLSPAS